MFEQAQSELSTLRDLMRFAGSRFNEAGLFYGHGTDNAWDEEAYLLLHTLHLPHDQLDHIIDARLTSDERSALLKVIERRISERLSYESCLYPLIKQRQADAGHFRSP